METEWSDYQKYRGKCKEMSEAACAADPTLTLVRGWYHDLLWGKQAHWWCVKPNGKIVDPTALQFPTKGHGYYEPFNGLVECAECHEEIEEHKAQFEGRYAFCSGRCKLRFVGLA